MIKQICARILSLLTVFLLLNSLAYSFYSKSDFHKQNNKKREFTFSHKDTYSSVLIIENEDIETRIDENYDELIDSKIYELSPIFTFTTKTPNQATSFAILKQNESVLKSEKWMINIQILI